MRLAHNTTIMCVMAAVTVDMTELALGLLPLYERAVALQDGFAKKHKVRMTRLLRLPMKPLTIARLLDGIETVVRDLTDLEADVLARCRARVQGAAPLEPGRVHPLDVAIAAARAAYGRLLEIGMPASRLPSLEDGRFNASAAGVVAAIDAYIRDHHADCRAAAWAARTAELAHDAHDHLAREEAARLVELACRWATERLVEGERARAQVPDVSDYVDGERAT